MNQRPPVCVQRPSDIPKCEHWAIIRGTSTFVPGDERSRTNPGHGYPEHTEHNITYRAYMDKESFEKDLSDELQRHFSSGVIGIHVQGVVVGEKVIKLAEQS